MAPTIPKDLGQQVEELISSARKSNDPQRYSICILGRSSSGKSTIGKLVAAKLNDEYFDDGREPVRILPADFSKTKHFKAAVSAHNVTFIDEGHSIAKGEQQFLCPALLEHLDEKPAAVKFSVIIGYESTLGDLVIKDEGFQARFNLVYKLAIPSTVELATGFISKTEASYNTGPRNERLRFSSAPEQLANDANFERLALHFLWRLSGAVGWKFYALRNLETGRLSLSRAKQACRELAEIYSDILQ